MRCSDAYDNFANQFDGLKVGNHATVEVERDGIILQITVPIEPFDQPEVKIQELPNPSDHQKAILARWSAGQ
jgi:hypothetical protein